MFVAVDQEPFDEMILKTGKQSVTKYEIKKNL